MMAIKIEKIMLDKLEKLEEGVTKWAMSRRERECKLSTPRRDALERSGNASLLLCQASLRPFRILQVFLDHRI